MKSRFFLLFGVALATATSSRAGFTPVALQSSSYNADVIVEQNATPVLTVSTTASIDNGTNNTANTWFEAGFDTNNPGNGIPAHDTTFTAADASTYTFHTAPTYTGPNGILIDSVVTNGTFTLATPAAYSKLSFFGSGGNGGDSINVAVHHADGTTETGNFGCPDWFGGSGVAWIAGGRCNSTVNLTTETDGNSGDGRGNPRIYYRDVTLANTTSPVTNIVLSYASGSSSSHNDIMGVSGATTVGGPVTPIAVTGYTYDFIVESNAPHSGRVFSQVLSGGTNLFATTQSLDATNNTGTSWYEQGYNLNNDAGNNGFNNPIHDLTGTGLPHPGSLITNAAGDHIYKLASDYTVNDAVYISTAVQNATITLATPASFSGLSFLGSAGSGPVVVQALVHHADSTSENVSLSIADWFNGNAPAAFAANGRVTVDSAQFQNVGSGFPRLLQNDVVLSNSSSPVVSIDLVYTNTAGGRFAIFAMSGSAGALPPVIGTQPNPTNFYQGSQGSLAATASANVPITYQWKKGTNGVFVNATDSGTVVGSTTSTIAFLNGAASDDADYELVATDSAGSVTSLVVHATVISTLPVITQPSDPISLYQPNGGSTPGAQVVGFAIDGTTSKYLNFGGNNGSPFVGPVGFVVTPAVGLTLCQTMILYCADDSTERDPAIVTLEGSVDGGSHYTLITTNSIVMPTTRNVAGNPLDPTIDSIYQIQFTNATSYTTYRWAVWQTRSSSTANSMQIGEVDLLGSTTSGTYFTSQPTSQKAFNGGSATFNASATGPTTPTISWKKGTNGVYVALSDAGNISGSQTGSLNINPVGFADKADYVAVANGSTVVTSTVATLTVYSSTPNIAQPSDPIVGFGDTTGTRYGANTNAAYVIDQTFIEYINGGSGLNASAGFPPFGGPVGVIITPQVGSTVLTGLRIYPGTNTPNDDPGSYTLQGSINGGSSYTTIASGTLALPVDRNPIALGVDPIGANAQEILFANTHGYTSYKLSFGTVRTPNSADSLHVGEVEFLGVQAPPQTVIGTSSLSSGNFTITGSGGSPNGTYTLLTNGVASASLSTWGVAKTGSFDGSGNFSVSLPVNAANTKLFYAIKTP